MSEGADIIYCPIIKNAELLLNTEYRTLVQTDRLIDKYYKCVFEWPDRLPSHTFRIAINRYKSYLCICEYCIWSMLKRFCNLAIVQNTGIGYIQNMDTVDMSASAALSP
jgi:hypothetical protein